MSLIRIATRNSPLALWQANYVKDALLQVHDDLSIDIAGMTTKGDELLDQSLSLVGGKGLFLKELEVSLLNEETDIAVHSMKDVPTQLPDGLEISVVCEREDPRDAMVSSKYQNMYALPENSVVGTSSLRRVSQLKHAFPHIEFKELRGNINTRLAKLDAGEYDAIILAAAGLIRMGFEDRIMHYISPDLCLPAVGQGIVGIECRDSDEEIKALLAPLNNRNAEIFLAAERAMNKALEGGCSVPIGGFAELSGGKIMMRGVVGEPDGGKVIRSSHNTTQISVASAIQLGQQVAQELLDQGAVDILKSAAQEFDVQRASLDSESHKPESVAEEPSKDLSKDAVIVTRQKGFLGNTQFILEHFGHPVFHVPTLDIKVSSNDDVVQKLSNLNQYTDLVFVSRNAVKVGMQLINKYGTVPQNIRVMTVGPETAKQLYKMGIEALFPQAGVGAEALLKVSQIRDLSGRKILIIRGAGGLIWPSDEMRKRGAQVDHANCYMQLLPVESASKLSTILDENVALGGVFVHSEQSVINLIAMAGLGAHKLGKTKLIAGSQRIADAARNRGWSGEIVVAESPANKHMLMAFSA